MKNKAVIRAKKKLPKAERDINVVPEKVVVTKEDSVWESVMPSAVMDLLDATVIGESDG